MPVRQISTGILISAFAVLFIACGSEAGSDTGPAAQSDGAKTSAPSDVEATTNATSQPAGDAEPLDLFSCAGVLGEATQGYDLDTRDATAEASSGNPSIESMCTASWSSSAADSEFLTASVITFTTNSAAADHFNLVSSEFDEAPRPTTDSVGSGPEILGTVINQGGIGSMVFSRDQRVMVTAHSGPSTTDESIWNVDFLLDMAASIMERTPDSLRAE